MLKYLSSFSLEFHMKTEYEEFLLVILTTEFIPCRKQISSTFVALAKQHGGYLGKEQALELLSSVGMEGKEKHEAAELLWSEMRLAEDAHITEANLFSSTSYYISPSANLDIWDFFKCI